MAVFLEHKVSNIISYYRLPQVQRRIAEYCGGEPESPQNFSCEYLAGAGESLIAAGISPDGWTAFSREDFPWLLRQGVDVMRSNWDCNSTIGILDIEYYNLDYPGEAFFYPERTFATLEPIYQASLHELYRFGIVPLSIMTGRGYHLVFRLKRYSLAEQETALLGKVVPSLADKYIKPPVPYLKRYVSRGHGRVFDGMGRLLEYLAHRIIRAVRREFPLPVMLGDLAVGNTGEHGREAISLDLSMYGDPLYTRVIRCPFSSYQKHRLSRDNYGQKTVERRPNLLSLPRGDFNYMELFTLRQNYARAAEYAQAVNVIIPDVSAAWENIIAAYRRSQLYRFHRSFDQEEGRPPEVLEKILSEEKIPLCVRHCLDVPDDNLLKPTNLQTLVRFFLNRGWHPAELAKLIGWRYLQEASWENLWYYYDAFARASLYVRIYSGLLLTGLDNEIDFNCVSHREKGYCWGKGCSWNLADCHLSQ